MDHLADAIGIVASVGDEDLRHREVAIDEKVEALVVGDLSAGQFDGGGQAGDVGREVDLARKATSRALKTLVRNFFNIPLSGASTLSEARDDGLGRARERVGVEVCQLQRLDLAGALCRCLGVAWIVVVRDEAGRETAPVAGLHLRVLPRDALERSCCRSSEPYQALGPRSSAPPA